MPDYYKVIVNPMDLESVRKVRDDKKKKVFIFLAIEKNCHLNEINVMYAYLLEYF